MILITKSPTGAFNLGYNVGDQASLSPDLEKKLIDAGYATPIEDEKPKGKK